MRTPSSIWISDPFHIKKVALLVYTIFCALTTSAQDRAANLIGQYKWKTPVVMVSCKNDGTNDNNLKTVTSYTGQLFDVIAVSTADTSYVVIQYVDYNSKETTRIKEYTFHETNRTYDAVTPEDKSVSEFGDNQLYFKIKIAVLQVAAKNMNTKKKEKISGAFTVGVLNLPFKYRGQPGHQDFTGSFNLGVALGYTFQHDSTNKWAYSIVSGYSISDINLDSSSVTRNADLLKSSNNFSALSLSLGFLVTYNDKIQAGLFLGTDILSKINDQTYDWVYQGRPWISIGFGLSIFSFSTSTPTTNSVVKTLQ